MAAAARGIRLRSTHLLAAAAATLWRCQALRNVPTMLRMLKTPFPSEDGDFSARVGPADRVPSRRTAAPPRAVRMPAGREKSAGVPSAVWPRRPVRWTTTLPRRPSPIFLSHTKLRKNAGQSENPNHPMTTEVQRNSVAVRRMALNYKTKPVASSRYCRPLILRSHLPCANRRYRQRKTHLLFSSGGSKLFRIGLTRSACWLSTSWWRSVIRHKFDMLCK